MPLGLIDCASNVLQAQLACGHCATHLALLSSFACAIVTQGEQRLGGVRAVAARELHAARLRRPAEGDAHRAAAERSISQCRRRRHSECRAVVRTCTIPGLLPKWYSLLDFVIDQSAD